MLKLTHSFCRYTKFTCENINFNTTHVKNYSYLGCGGRTVLYTLYAQHTIAQALIHTCQQLRLLVNIKKKAQVKHPHLSKATSETMKSHLMPSLVIKEEEEAERGGPSGAGPSSRSPPQPDGERPSTSTVHFVNQSNRMPPNRVWEFVNMPGANNFKFKVVSYNVLAQNLLHSHENLYKACSREHLAWPARFERIFRDIMLLNPDIVCLQEVQRAHIKQYFVRFEHSGYYGIFKQKTGNKQDGCAIYYRRDVFDLVEHINVECLQPDVPLLNRDNVGLMLKLVPFVCTTTAVVVATTHLLYNPKRDDVRIAQMQIMLAELDRFAFYERNNGRDSGHYPIVFTGDFNCLPNSAVIQLLNTGAVPFDNTGISVQYHKDLWRSGVTNKCQHLAVIMERARGVRSDHGMIKLFHSERLKNAIPVLQEAGAEEVARASTDKQLNLMRYTSLFNSPLMTYDLSLSSVYLYNKHDNTREATTFQEKWVAVDYIYYRCDRKLRLLDRLRLPTVEECQTMGPLPNDMCGSDHVMLAAHFEIYDESSER